MIVYNQSGREEIEQPEVIAAPKSTTGEQLMATVDTWRLQRS